MGPAAAMNVLARIRGSKLGLRTHLVLFGLAIVVPVLIYSAFLLHRYSQSERGRASNGCCRSPAPSTPTSTARSRPSSPRWRRLPPRTRSPYKDFKSFHLQAKEALKSRPWNVVSSTPIAANSSIRGCRWGTPLPVSEAAEPDLVRIARETGRPYVSDLFMGTVAKRWIFSVSVPVRPRKESSMRWSCRWSRSGWSRS